MRVSYLSFSILLGASSLLSADVISGSVSCSAPSGDFNYLTSVKQESSTSCNVQTTVTDIPAGYLYFSPNQFANAFVSGDYSLGSNEISGDLRSVVGSSVQASATSQITFSDTLTTTGQLRTGILGGGFLPSTSGYGGVESVTLVSPAVPYSNFGPSLPISFQLGQPFTLTIVGSARSLSDDGTPSAAQFDIPFAFAFFEADGVTPVALAEVTPAAAPEPSTWVFLAAGLAILAGWKGRRVATR